MPPSSAFLAPLTPHTHPQFSSSPTLGRHPPLLVLITVTICTGEGGKIVQEQRKDKRTGSYCPARGRYRRFYGEQGMYTTVLLLMLSRFGVVIVVCGVEDVYFMSFWISFALPLLPSVSLIVKFYISENIYCLCASLCVYELCVCTRAGARTRVYVCVSGICLQSDQRRGVNSVKKKCKWEQVSTGKQRGARCTCTFILPVPCQTHLHL